MDRIRTIVFIGRRSGIAKTEGHVHQVLLMCKRVLLVGLPELMEDLVRRACSEDPDIDVAPSIADVSELAGELMRQDVDVVIAGLRGGVHAGLPLSLFHIRPEVRVLLITLPTAAAELFELQPIQLNLGKVSPHEIVRALQGGWTHAQGWSALNRAAGHP